MVYDHFLARDATVFIDSSLFGFTQKVYSAIDGYISILPKNFQAMYPYMKEYNWLYNYQHQWGIARSFEGLVRRAKYLTESQTAYRIFEKKYPELNEQYLIFFPALKIFATDIFNSLNSAAK